MTSSGDATVKIWDFKRSECVHTFTEHNKPGAHIPPDVALQNEMKTRESNNALVLFATSSFAILCRRNLAGVSCFISLKGIPGVHRPGDLMFSGLMFSRKSSRPRSALLCFR